MVDTEFGLSATVVNGVAGVLRAVGQGAVGYVDGILAAFRDFGYPFGCTFFSFTDGFGLSVGTFLKGIFKVFVDVALVGESLSLAVAPLMVGIAFSVERLPIQTTVIVHNHFVGLRVAFAGQQYVGTCILEHGHEKGQDITLCVEVFYRLEDACALPFPAVELGLIIEAVALPHGDVPVVQSSGRGIGRRFFAD